MLAVSIMLYLTHHEACHAAKGRHGTGLVRCVSRVNTAPAGDRGLPLWLPRVGAAVQMPLAVLVSVVLYRCFKIPLMQVGKCLAQPKQQPIHAA